MRRAAAWFVVYSSISPQATPVLAICCVYAGAGKWTSTIVFNCWCLGQDDTASWYRVQSGTFGTFLSRPGTWITVAWHSVLRDDNIISRKQRVLAKPSTREWLWLGQSVLPFHQIQIHWILPNIFVDIAGTWTWWDTGRLRYPAGPRGGALGVLVALGLGASKTLVSFFVGIWHSVHRCFFGFILFNRWLHCWAVSTTSLLLLLL